MCKQNASKMHIACVRPTDLLWEYSKFKVRCQLTSLPVSDKCTPYMQLDRFGDLELRVGIRT
jgi:hypothetical protein